MRMAGQTDPVLTSELKKLQTLENAIGHVKAELEPLLARPRDEVMAQMTSPTQKAKLSVATAYTISSLFYILLKAKGADTTKHDVIPTLKSVGTAFAKVKSATSSSSEKPKIRVNAEAGKRVVQHALAANASLQEKPVPLGGLAKAATSSSSEKKRDRDAPTKQPKEMKQKANKKKKHATSASDYM